MKKEEKIEKVAGDSIKLPPEGQRAMDFMIKNFDTIKKMCENSGMTNEEINERMKKAKMSGDYILLGLLCAA